MGLDALSYRKLSVRTGYFSNSTNVGVFESNGKLYVVDTADSADDGKQIVDSLGTLFPGKPIAAVINTHGHSDHVGGNSAIVALTQAEVWAPNTESIFIEHPELVGDLYWGGRKFSALESHMFRTATPCHVTRYITEGKIELEDVFLEIVPLPGHFFDQSGIIVHDKTDGASVFFLGDGFFGTKILKRYWIPFMQDEELFRQSVSKIESIECTWYVPSHGKACNYDRMLALAELNTIITYETENLILKILHDKPSTAEEILKQVADFAGFKMRLGQIMLIGTTIRSYLSSMERRGLLEFDVYNNMLLWHEKK